jgi:hypothetical protein
MDQELKQHLEAMESRLENRLDNRIGTLDSRIGALDARLEAMDAKFATKQDLERVETNLLTEFHKWASPAEARAKTHTAAIRAIDLEMEALTERVQKLEKHD